MLTHFCTNEHTYGPKQTEDRLPGDVECADCGEMWERDSTAAYRKARRENAAEI